MVTMSPEYEETNRDTKIFTGLIIVLYFILHLMTYFLKNFNETILDFCSENLLGLYTAYQCQVETGVESPVRSVTIVAKDQTVVMIIDMLNREKNWKDWRVKRESGQKSLSSENISIAIVPFAKNQSI